MRTESLLGTPKLRVTEKIWRSLGGDVKDLSGTGEEIYSHPSLDYTFKVNKRRKDTPKKLLTALRRLANGVTHDPLQAA